MTARIDLTLHTAVTIPFRHGGRVQKVERGEVSMEKKEGVGVYGCYMQSYKKGGKGEG